MPVNPRLFLIVIVSIGLAFPSAVFAHIGHKVEHNHPFPTKKFSVRNGKVVYAKFCASCHGNEGKGDGPAAASLNPRPSDFLHLKYMSMRSRVDHYDAIANGRPNTSMSPWKNTLSDKEIWDVIAYIEHLFNHRWDVSSKVTEELSH
ncbi:MAG: cytochrome c [Nitrospinota bacterium]|nr:cytochrome c [Nitrospinota bacterium]HJM42792.1 cytochrome c [Nitrospinota bacterium]